VLLLIAYYLLLLAFFLPLRRPRLRRCARLAPMAAVLLLFIPCLAGWTAVGGVRGELRITLLSIGAGQIGVIDLPDGGVALVDDGSSSIADPERSALAPYLHLEGRRHIKAIFLSHPDYDHISATAATVAEFGADQVLLNPYFPGQIEHNATAQAMLRALRADGCPIRIVHAGDVVPLDAEDVVRVLWPPLNHPFTTTNEAGLVLRLESRGRAVLLPADIQQKTEAELLAHPGRLQADVLVAPHHGSGEVTTLAFIQAVAPRYILASNDRTLTSKQRNFDAIAARWPLYRTNRLGAITIHISASGELSVTPFLEHPLADWTRWRPADLAAFAKRNGGE
jgi:competence protein ComEC